MAKKKKKMTKAQAAAARRDDGRSKRTYTPGSIDSGPKESNTRMVMIITIICIAVIVVLSAVYAIPGIVG